MTPPPPSPEAVHTHRRPVPRTPRPLRVLLPALLILGWLVAAGIGGPYFGRVDEVTDNDQTAYLPASAEATTVQERLPDFLGDDTVPAIVVFTSDTELTDAQLDELRSVTDGLDGLAGVAGDEVSPVIPSEDGRAAQVFVPVDSAADVAGVVDALRDELA